MKKYLWTTGWVAAQALLLNGCGVENKNGQELKVRNGAYSAAQDLSPKMTVQVESPNGLCTGVIIGEKHVLTAAHCGVVADQSTLYFYTGASKNGDQVKVRQVKINPDYFTNFMTDVALLTVDPINMNKYTAAELPTLWESKPTAGTQAWLSGTGDHDNGATSALGFLKWKAVTVQNQNSSVNNFSTDIAADHGDSGGPLFISSVIPGKLKLIGIVKGETTAGDFDYYTSISQLASWIYWETIF